MRGRKGEGERVRARGREREGERVWARGREGECEGVRACACEGKGEGARARARGREGEGARASATVHMRWSYSGSWSHLDKLGPLGPVFRALPEWARPCPMSVDVMRLGFQLSIVFSASALLMRGTKAPLPPPAPESQ